MNTEQEVIDIVVGQLGVEPGEVSLETDLMQDLHADSLDLTELIMAFEERFGFEIPSEKAEKLKTVGDVVNYIKSQQ